MKISEIISYLEEQKERLGDIVVYTEHNDGRDTWSQPADVQLRFHAKFSNSDRADATKYCHLEG